MFTTEEQTEERVDAYVAALEAEKEGYEAPARSRRPSRRTTTSSRSWASASPAVDAELARFKESKKKDGATSSDRPPARHERQEGRRKAPLVSSIDRSRKTPRPPQARARPAPRPRPPREEQLMIRIKRKFDPRRSPLGARRSKPPARATPSRPRRRTSRCRSSAATARTSRPASSTPARRGLAVARRRRASGSAPPTASPTPRSRCSRCPASTAATAAASSGRQRDRAGARRRAPRRRGVARPAAPGRLPRQPRLRCEVI
jgi:hypothetical protein